MNCGDVIYSNLYRPMFTVVADDVGNHDLFHPCCSKDMYRFFYGNGDNHPNCLDNINGALGSGRKIINPVNLFMNTRVDTDGTISVERPFSKPGDKVVLRAETDVVVAVASCSVSESECNSKKCSSIKIVIE